MVFAFLEGRLGNNLWQIGAAATLAAKWQDSFSAVVSDTYWCTEPDNCPLEEYIKPFRKTIFRHIQFIDSLPPDTMHVEYGVRGQLLLQKPAENVCLHCCYPNMEMIDVSLVQHLFAPTAEQRDFLFAAYPVLNHPCTCSVVVRRGDYLRLPLTNPAEDYGYYHKCMHRIEKRLHTKEIQYVIVSDDVAWGKTHFSAENMYVVDNNDPLCDLYINALCNHNILSNSTFALWGGVLNLFSNKIVYYPSPWVGMGMRKQVQLIPTLPKDWIAVRHYSWHYIYGVVLWLWHGIVNTIRKAVRE